MAPEGKYRQTRAWLNNLLLSHANYKVNLYSLSKVYRSIISPYLSMTHQMHTSSSYVKTTSITVHVKVNVLSDWEHYIPCSSLGTGLFYVWSLESFRTWAWCYCHTVVFQFVQTLTYELNDFTNAPPISCYEERVWFTLIAPVTQAVHHSLSLFSHKTKYLLLLWVVKSHSMMRHISLVNWGK